MMKLHGILLQRYNPQAGNNPENAEMLTMMAKGAILHNLNSFSTYADLFNSKDNHFQAWESLILSSDMQYTVQDLHKHLSQPERLAGWLEPRVLNINLGAQVQDGQKIAFLRRFIFVNHVAQLFKAPARHGFSPPYYTDLKSLKLRPETVQALQTMEATYNTWQTAVNEALSCIQNEYARHE